MLSGSGRQLTSSLPLQGTRCYQNAIVLRVQDLLQNGSMQWQEKPNTARTHIK